LKFADLELITQSLTWAGAVDSRSELEFASTELLSALCPMEKGRQARLEHEYALRAELDRSWAARPLALTQYDNRLALVLEDPGGEPLDRFC
jgi:hypothetical protein